MGELREPSQSKTCITIFRKHCILVFRKCYILNFRFYSIVNFRSHRCSVCWFAKSELESSADEIEAQAEMHFIDVVNSREVSNYIVDKLGVRHESPQAILLKDGEGVWHASHGAIKSAKILNMLE